MVRFTKNSIENEFSFHSPLILDDVPFCGLVFLFISFFFYYFFRREIQVNF